MRVVLFAVLALLAASAASVALSAQSPALAAAAQSILGADQGVYVEAANGTVLLAQAASVAVHPASVSKVPTTLALLRKLGPEHRFITTFTAKGRVVNGTLYGDLVVASDGDPSLVDEDALLIAERLRQSGISRVSGTLQLKGPLTFDWKTDSDGASLRRAMSGLTPPAALAAVRALEVLNTTGAAATTGPLAPLGIRFATGTALAVGTASTGGTAPAVGTALAVGAASTGGTAPTAGTTPAVGTAPLAGTAPAVGTRPIAATALGVSTALTAGTALGVNTASAGIIAPGPGAIELTGEHPLIVHRSQPLLPLVKSLNDYSNNIFAPFAAAAGGAAAVESLARSVVPAEMRFEITLGDGAGADPTNRLSPRAAVKLLRVLEQELAKSDHALCDILPVAGIDDGTLHDRLNGPGEAGHVLGKTGTFGDYGASALIGALRTTDHGTVYFAILNHDVPVPQARHRQDRFVRFLLTQLHTVPWSYERDPRPAISRAEVSIMLP